MFEVEQVVQALLVVQVAQALLVVQEEQQLAGSYYLARMADSCG